MSSLSLRVLWTRTDMLTMLSTSNGCRMLLFFILKQLEEDVDFGFEKALNQRGLSAPAMYIVVRMWMWILEDDLQYVHSDQCQ